MLYLKIYVIFLYSTAQYISFNMHFISLYYLNLFVNV